MNVADIADVGGDRHAGVRNLQSFQLRLPDSGQSGRFTTVFIGSQLHKVEGHFFVVPYITPAVDQRLLFLVVEHAFAVVAFPLIPKRPPDAVWVDRRNHAIMQSKCGLVIYRAVVAFLRECVELVGDILQGWHGPETARCGPRFDAGAAPVAAEEPDRHIKFALKMARKKVPNGGEVAHRLRAANQPTIGGDISLFLGARPVRNLDVTNQWMLGISDFLVGIV